MAPRWTALCASDPWWSNTHSASLHVVMCLECLEDSWLLKMFVLQIEYSAIWSAGLASVTFVVPRYSPLTLPTPAYGVRRKKYHSSLTGAYIFK